MSRPSIFTSELAAAICAKLMEGQSLRTICASEAMPGATTIYRWLGENEIFREQYARAREDQADTLADEIIDIADEQAEVRKVDGTTYDPDVGRDKLRVDARKWVAAKLKPKKYGDKVDVAHSGGVTVNIEATDANL